MSKNDRIRTLSKLETLRRFREEISILAKQGLNYETCEMSREILADYERLLKKEENAHAETVKRSS